MTRLAPVLLALTLAAATATPARADLVIQGRAAQALHCAAMLYLVSDKLHAAGRIDARTLNTAQVSAVRMLNYVPGTEDQKVKAMGQRFAKLMRTRTLGGLFAEYDKTAKWCNATFL